MAQAAPDVFLWPVHRNDQRTDADVGVSTGTPAENLSMAGNAKGIVFGSMGVGALMGVLAIVDIALGIPFGGQVSFDVMFILAAALVVYMGVDCLKGMR